MCLIAIAHRASDAFPLVIAANRDEDHERATHAAHVWSDANDVIGGRDALHGGAWLAIARSGRFAAVTNLRGAAKTPQSRSRGELVRGFVTGADSPYDYASRIVPAEYAGFHLLTGEIGGELVLLSSSLHRLEPGVYGLSNAPEGETWPKVAYAAERLRNAIETLDANALTADLLRFLATPRGTDDPRHEIFIRGDRYGTRSSTVIIASADEITFTEQSWARGGIVAGAPRTLRFAR
ncbi:MAG TPA: NRDE family protein [Thermoanaerobaculia bacterium]|nr:NRDE family protein [Thermoanaerobaculia bacterium]